MAKRSKLQRAHRQLGGFAKTRRNIKKFGDRMGEELNRVAIQTAQRVKNEAERVLMSGEGRAPDPETFELARSIAMVIKRAKRRTTIHVGTAVMHGFYQEMGTVKHPTHPWLFPALRRAKPFYAQELQKLVDRATSGIDSASED